MLGYEHASISLSENVNSGLKMETLGSDLIKFDIDIIKSICWCVQQYDIYSLQCKILEISFVNVLILIYL